ncbi:MAG: hypothetical protein RSB57_02755, partial [Hungatella sp.]
LVQIIMHQEFFKNKEHYYETVFFTLKDGFDGFEQIREKFREHNIEVASIEMKQRKHTEVAVEVLLILPADCDKVKLMDLIGSSSGVVSTKC